MRTVYSELTYNNLIVCIILFIYEMKANFI